MTGLDLSILIVSWNTCGLLAACLESVGRGLAGGSLRYEVIVVDNGSTDGTQAMLRARFPGVMLLENRDNVGFARANNQGFRRCRGRAVLLLNPDALVERGVTVEHIVGPSDARPHPANLFTYDL